MCGRTCCNCNPETYRKASTYFDQNLDKYVLPRFDQLPGHDFHPSTNTAPTDFSPIIMSGDHLNEETTSRIIRPMLWGMIPHWHQGNYKSHGLSTNNCRIEGILTSKLYSNSLKKGYRCVVICDGFYEWQTTKGKTKQPYFIYTPQSNHLRPELSEDWNNAVWSESKGWNGPKPLLMAGLFNQWFSSEDEIIYSYSIITMESSEALSWLHSRMPAILTSDEQVKNWLDFDAVEYKEALESLTPVKTVSYHPVSSLVNNSRNKDSTCNKPVTLSKESKSSLLMQSWLKRGKKEDEKSLENKSNEISTTPPSVKKIKK